MDLDAIFNAIIAQESGGRGPNPGQIQSGTWAQYAQPDEKITNREDNLRVAKRIVADYHKRYSGDPQRIATAYFSGPGNVAPANSQTPYLQNKADRSGKQTASYVSDISRRLASMDEPDLLGSWGTPQQAAQPAEQDLLSAWTKAATPVQTAMPMPPPRPAAPIEPGYRSPENADLARFIEQNQGEGFVPTVARLGAGGVRGIEDVADTLAQGISATGEKGAGVLERLGIISPETTKIVSEWRKRVNAGITQDHAIYEKAAKGSLAADLGRITGQIAGTGPFIAAGGAALPVMRGGSALANLGRSAVTGAGIGGAAAGLTSATSPAPLSEQIMQGAAAGGVLGPAGRIAAGAGAKLAGTIDPYVAKLADSAKQFGININPMQLASNNSLLRFTQSMLQRMPFSGFGPAARKQSAEWESALIGEMGQTGNKVTPDLIANAQKDLGKQYDTINSKLGSILMDDAAVGNLDRVAKDTDFSRIKNIVETIKSKISHGTINAADHQEIYRKNGPLNKALNNPDSSVREDAQHIKSVLDDVLKSVDPASYAARKEVDYKWAVMKALDKASEGQPAGGLSPNKVFNAFKDYGQGEGARAATRLGQIGKQFLVEPPSSGTWERAASTIAGTTMLGGLAGLGWHEWDPENLQALIGKGGLGLAAILAARYGVSPALRSKSLADLMVRRSLPGAVSQPNELANLLRTTSIPAAAISFRNSP